MLHLNVTSTLCLGFLIVLRSVEAPLERPSARWSLVHEYVRRVQHKGTSLQPCKAISQVQGSTKWSTTGFSKQGCRSRLMPRSNEYQLSKWVRKTEKSHHTEPMNEGMLCGEYKAVNGYAALATRSTYHKWEWSSQIGKAQWPLAKGFGLMIPDRWVF